jgi:cytochrome b
LVVWDPLLRVLHWGLAVSVIVAFFTHARAALVHDIAGYAALALAAVRLVWGFVGPAPARFENFIVSPAATWRYAKALLKGAEPHCVGHNPLGAWMIVALLVTVAGASASGWLFETDAFWGDALVEEVHAFFGNLFVPLVALHVGGVIVTSIRQKENLVAAMIHGRKIVDE